jgi:hypothetical protein
MEEEKHKKNNPGEKFYAFPNKATLWKTGKSLRHH